MDIPGCFAIVLFFFIFASPLLGQRQQHDPLTYAQAEQIREAGIDPPERVKLYTKFVNEHIDGIKALSKRSRSVARDHLIDNALQNLESLMDEFGSNLDVYSDRKADVRRSLKPLAEDTQHWVAYLRGLASEPNYELSLKEAIDSAQDLANQAASMLKEQTAFFDLHKDERGQDRQEPQ